MSNLLPPASVLRHVVDVHCHPTDAPFVLPESMDNLQITICAMSTRQSDQQLVRNLALAYPSKVVPCFGYHPWFTHHISIHSFTSKDDHYRSLFLTSPSPPPDHITAFENLLPLLPDPIPLPSILADLRSNLNAVSDAMLGEVGLDRSFRVPYDYSSTQRQLTPFVVPSDHQLAILEAQLDLAAELGRNISFHSVRSPLPTMKLLDRMKDKHQDRWAHINIDLHSCGLTIESWRDIERRHHNVFLSLSTVINGRSLNHRALIAGCSEHRLLVESDFNDVNYCAERTWDMVKTVAEVKNWSLEKEWVDEVEENDWGTVRRLERNWLAFKTGRQMSNER